MEPTLQQALAAVLNSTTDAIQSGVAFLQAEIPDVIKQLLVWELTRALILGIGCALIVATCLYLAVARGLRYARASAARELAWRKYNNTSRYSDGEEAYEAARDEYYQTPDGHPVDMVFVVVGGAASVALIAPAVMYLLTALQVWIAPKIFLVEYAARLAR